MKKVKETYKILEIYTLEKWVNNEKSQKIETGEMKWHTFKSLKHVTLKSSGKIKNILEKPRRFVRLKKWEP